MHFAFSFLLGAVGMYVTAPLTLTKKRGALINLKRGVLASTGDSGKAHLSSHCASCLVPKV